MSKKHETDTLNERIVVLERRQAMEMNALKEQFHLTYESLRPMNILKKSLSEIATAPGLKSGIINGVIGLATGYLSKKVLIGSSHNPIKRIIGTLMEYAIANVTAKHGDKIKWVGENILNKVFKRKKEAADHVFYQQNN